MKFRISIAIGVLACGVSAFSVGARPANTPATHADILAEQSLGKIIISPNAHYIVCEWLKPYNWIRDDLRKLDRKTTRRDQAWLYHIDLTPASYTPDTAQYLFIPLPRATYWLGSVSPDYALASFYELDYDTNVVTMGVWRKVDDKVVRFETPADDARVSQAPQWLSADEIVYPGKNGKLIKASFATGTSVVCPDCRRAPEPAPAAAAVKVVPKAVEAPSPSAAPAGSVPGSGDDEKVPDPEHDPNFRLVGKSPNGEIAVYVKDTPDVLSLVFTRKWASEPIVVFQNKRVPGTSSRATSVARN